MNIPHRRPGVTWAFLVLAVLPSTMSAPAGAAAPTGQQPTLPANATPAPGSEPFEITARADPEVVLSAAGNGGTPRKVVISGDTLPAGARPVTLTIRPPGAAAVTATAAVDARGHYSYGEYIPRSPGTHTVEVTAPDNRGKASTQFKVLAPADLASRTEAVVQAAAKAAQRGAKAAQQKIDEMPESPAKDQAQRRLAAALAAVDAQADHSGADAANGVVSAITADMVVMQMVRGGVDTLTDELQETESATAKVNQLADEASSALVGCHQLAFVSELFKTISAALNIKKKVLDTVIGFAKDVSADAATNKAKALGAGPALGFAAGQAVKNLPELNSASKLAGNAYSILADLGAFVSDSLFNAYCEQFIGPVSASMKAKFFAPSDSGPAMWWQYDFKLTGRMMVYYPKDAHGSSIRVKGRIEGYAHDFHTWENALVVLFPKLMSSAIQYKWEFPPLEIGGGAASVITQGSTPLSAYIEGSAPSQLGPASFLFDIDGVLEKDTLTITLGKSLSDFNSKYRALVMIVAPLSAGVGAQFTAYSLPFKNAYHVFDRTARSGPLRMPVKKSGNQMTAEGSFQGHSGDTRALGEYEVSLKACNPGC